jgi:hypothetical protein
VGTWWREPGKTSPKTRLFLLPALYVRTLFRKGLSIKVGSMRKLLLSIGIALIILVILVVGFFALNRYIYNEKQADEVDPTISLFEECIDAGYPVLDAYPFSA